MQLTINLLLVAGFTVTAYSTFKDHNPFAAVSMILSLVILFIINP